MEQKHIETTHLPEGDPRLPTFFAWCDKHELFDATRGDKGRMRRVYRGFPGRKPTLSITASVAYESDKPMGICLLEPQSDALHPARIRHLDERRKQPRKELAWSFLDVGFLSVYVHPDYRKIGVAHALMAAMEEELVARHSKWVGHRLMATAKEDAQPLVAGSRWLNLNECAPTDGNWMYAISDHASDVWQEREHVKPAMGDPLPLAVFMPAYEPWNMTGSLISKLKVQRSKVPSVSTPISLGPVA